MFLLFHYLGMATNITNSRLRCNNLLLYLEWADGRIYVPLVLNVKMMQPRELLGKQHDMNELFVCNQVMLVKPK